MTLSGRPLPPAQPDPQIGKLEANLQDMYSQLLSLERRSGFVLWLLLAVCASNVGVLVWDVAWRKDHWFVAWCNLSAFVTVAYYREHRQSKVTPRFVGLVNTALSSCFLQLRPQGSRVHLQNLTTSSN